MQIECYEISKWIVENPTKWNSGTLSNTQYSYLGYNPYNFCGLGEPSYEEIVYKAKENIQFYEGEISKKYLIVIMIDGVPKLCVKGSEDDAKNLVDEYSRESQSCDEEYTYCMVEYKDINI